METRERRRSLVGPLILIGLGTLFLLGNLGLVTWSVWELLLRVWPVLLIALGLEVLFGRGSLLGSIIVVLLTMLMVGAILWFYPVSRSIGGPQGPTAGQPVVGNEFRQPVEGATWGDVRIAFSAGELNLEATDDPSVLAEGTLRSNDGETAGREFRIEGGTAYFRLRGEGFALGPRMGANREWDLRLNGQLPIKLQVNTGAGVSDLRLERTRVEELELDSGVGRTRVTLPQTGRVVARVNGGVGELEVEIPEGVAGRIRATLGIGEVQVSPRFVRNGDEYISPDFDTSANRVELNIRGGIGKVSVR